MSNVVRLDDYRPKPPTLPGDQRWDDYHGRMDRFELLEEMVRFQEDRSRVGRLTKNLAERGLSLFATIEAVAETEELRRLSVSYRQHLAKELTSGRLG